ncbi:unnamed protein product [Auanema sp. JU1783]|nr:unnamed protein product [Auanema sp. JU1783]
MSFVSRSLRSIRSLEQAHRASTNLLRLDRAKEVSLHARASSASASHVAFKEEGTSSKVDLKVVPSKETLLRVDWLLEHLTPGILKSRLKAFFDICKEDVVFEDRLYNYNLSQRSQLAYHIAKIRMYFRYLSPYNKVERIGSCVYEGEDVIVLLWRLSTLESSFVSYFPSFITKKEPKINVSEGALDIFLTPEGKIHKMVNRKITASDREGARAMEKIKEERKKFEEKEEEKKIRKELNEMIMISPCVLRGVACSSRISFGCRRFSGDIDYSHEKPLPEQLDHVRQRIVETLPLLFRHKLDYTFYRKDVLCVDQIFMVEKKGLDELMDHFGKIGVMGQFIFPHIEMEPITVNPFLEDGTVRCRWRIKYITFTQLFTDLKLFRREYRLQHLRWYDGYSILSVDGNGQVYKLTIQKTQVDESQLLNEKSTSQKLAEKIAIFRPPTATSFVKVKRDRDRDLD